MLFKIDKINKMHLKSDENRKKQLQQLTYLNN